MKALKVKTMRKQDISYIYIYIYIYKTILSLKYGLAVLSSSALNQILCYFLNF